MQIIAIWIPGYTNIFRESKSVSKRDMHTQTKTNINISYVYAYACHLCIQQLYTSDGRLPFKFVYKFLYSKGRTNGFCMHLQKTSLNVVKFHIYTYIHLNFALQQISYVHIETPSEAQKLTSFAAKTIHSKSRRHHQRLGNNHNEMVLN